ncbi:hypothetical protein J2TS6_33930 [Paenibacillus albilobatus]|uniref:RHS repeat-associated core domain-containing protein n=1 Tax=Paenibacillus albilobatus TaxID=2716884 RepID=A0A919XG82_9BACL|nr:hypothetical protein J2TS6_33930 [Paenibacillus albilobatus]
MGEDTYKGELSDPLSLNLYTYVANNPLSYVDPSGHAGCLFDFRGGSGGARNFGGGGERGGGVGSIRVTKVTSTLSSGPYRVSSPSKVVVKNNLNNFPVKTTPNKSYFTPKYLNVGSVANKGMGNGVSRDTIINSATQAKKGGETVVGHALQKHAGRNPNIWGKVKGGSDQINQTAQRHLEDIY